MIKCSSIPSSYPSIQTDCGLWVHHHEKPRKALRVDEKVILRVDGLKDGELMI